MVDRYSVLVASLEQVQEEKEEDGNEGEGSDSDEFGHRHFIKLELMAQAQHLLDSFETHPVLLEIPERNYEARQTFPEDSTCCTTIIKFRCDGFN